MVRSMGQGERKAVGHNRILAGACAGLLLGALVVTMGGPARAEEGHNHGPAARTISVAPRTEARIGNQEAVLAYDRGKLVLFLQRYADGLPTSGAAIEMTIDFAPVTFEEVAPGTYVANDVMLAAGRNELEMTYKIGAHEGTETIALVLPQTAGQVASARSSGVPRAAVSGLLLAAIAAAIYAGVTAILALRSRPA